MKVDPGSDAGRLDDDALVVAIGRGDRDALRVLLERWGPRVRAFLQRTLGSTRDAEDLTQETFVRVYGAATRYRPSGRFPAWLFRIAGNLARRELRRRKLIALVLGEPDTRPEEIFASLPTSGSFDPESPLRDAEIRRAMASALARLPERQRMAVLLRFYEEMPVADIATALGIGTRAAESLLSRATRTLRALLQDLH